MCGGGGGGEVTPQDTRVANSKQPDGGSSEGARKRVTRTVASPTRITGPRGLDPQIFGKDILGA